MAVILIHIGKELPVYLKDCIKQLKIWGNNRIYLVTDLDNFGDEKLYPEVEFICKERFDSHLKIKKYNELQFFKPAGSFWDLTCKRIFYLESVMLEYLPIGRKKVWHIENDNLVYCNLDDVANIFCDIENGKRNRIGITPCTDTECTANFMLINNIESLSMITTEIIKLMELGMDGIKEKYHSSFVGEMRLLQIVSELLPDEFFHFPIMNEYGDYSIYDPASWGQLLDGIPGKPGLPGIFDVHKIGHYLLSLPENERKIDWQIDEQDRKYPTFKGNKIMNLHIHSKRLNPWLSK